MAANWMRRILVIAACASAALLTACGSSTTESALSPTRFITFGDGFTDLGQTGSRYTVNGTGAVDNWAYQLAATYGKTITASASGGTGYAYGNARVTYTPDAAGVSTYPTITQQVTKFLAADSFGSSDVVLMNGGISDIITNMAAVTAGTMTQAEFLAAAKTAGTELGEQVRRLVSAGAKYVVVAGTYDLSKSPWATAISQTSLLSSASTAFNSALLVDIVDLGSNVLYIDMAYYMNLMMYSPTTYGFTNSTTAVCTSTDSGNGIGIGTGQINSALCTSSTVISGADPYYYIYADNVYLSPRANRLLGTYAYSKLSTRW